MVEKNNFGGSIFLKVFLAFLLAASLFAAGGFCFWFFIQKTKEAVPLASSAPTIQPFKEEPVYVEEDLPLISPELTFSDKELLQAAFSKKYGYRSEEVEIEINKNADPYFSGGVHFSGEMGGGWFLAYKQNNQMIIVADGNGTVPCENIEPYDFPTDLAPECWNEATGVLITR